MTKALFRNGEPWNFSLLEKFNNLGKQYIQDLGFTYYDLQIEIISPEQMLGLYSSGALPMYYNHWSFGKNYINDYRDYYSGKKGLAYEICKDTNPCLCYCMETNSAIEQASVIWHVYGHSSHFASNYLFKINCDSAELLEYTNYAKNFVKACEDKYGEREVERVLDLAHSLETNSIFKYQRHDVDFSKKMLERELYLINNQNYLLDKLSPTKSAKPIYIDEDNIHSSSYSVPEENILYFVEKYSPVLTNWQRELCKIVRTLIQFSYQRIGGQSQVLAEGTAMFTECYMMEQAHSDGYIDEGNYLEYLNMNSWVLYQLDMNHRLKNPFDAMPHAKLNPYFLGLSIMRDIKRMCMQPTEEDRKFNSDICGSDWKTTLNSVISDYRDESLIRQFLSPHLIRKLRLMHVEYNTKNPDEYLVKSHAAYYDDVRKALADTKLVSNHVPNIEITAFHDNEVRLTYYPVCGRNLNEKYAKATCQNLAELMGSEVVLADEESIICLIR